MNTLHTVRWAHRRLASIMRKSRFSDELAKVEAVIRLVATGSASWSGDEGAGRRTKKGAALFGDFLSELSHRIQELEWDRRRLVLDAVVLAAYEARERLGAPTWLSMWMEDALPEDAGTVLDLSPVQPLMELVWMGHYSVRLAPWHMQEPQRSLQTAITEAVSLVNGSTLEVVEDLEGDGVFDVAVALFPFVHAPWRDTPLEPVAASLDLPSGAGVMAALALMAELVRDGRVRKAVAVVPNQVLAISGPEAAVRHHLLTEGLVAELHSMPSPWEGARRVWWHGPEPVPRYTAVVLTRNGGPVKMAGVRVAPAPLDETDEGPVMEGIVFDHLSPSLMADHGAIMVPSLLFPSPSGGRGSAQSRRRALEAARRLDGVLHRRRPG